MEGNHHSSSEASVLSTVNCENGCTTKQPETATSLTKEVYIYRQDTVRCSKHENMLGVVLEVSGDSDSDADLSESSDVEDDGGKVTDRNDKVKDAYVPNETQGEVQVRVMWINGSETTENHSEITVVDRELLHGDIVASVSDPTGQLGLVVDVNMWVDLLALNGEMIKQVSTRDLKRIRDFTEGDYVVCGPWLGRVDDVLDNVTVRFDDGSVCKVMKADPLRLKPISKSIVADSGFPYYPGQRVRAVSSYVLKNSRWISGSWKSSHLEGTVMNVQAASVFVYWIASAGTGTGGSSAVVPSEEQSPKNLTLLSCFAHSNWQLGDWCMLPLSATDNVSNSVEERSSADEASKNSSILSSEEKDSVSGVSSCETQSTLSKEHARETTASRKKLRKVFFRREKKLHKREESFQKAFLVACTAAKVDVAWQDGTMELGVEAKSLVPIQSPGEHEFFPEQYVAEQVSNEGDDPYQVKRVGVVKNINAKERTACVRWLKAVERPEDLLEFLNEEVVSVYELSEHPDYDYCYGDLVVRLSPPSVSADSLNSEDDHTDQPNEDGAGDFSSLSWVGHVTGLSDGSIEVTWADGMVSRVGPQAVYVVGREEGESFNGGSEISDDGASWETVEEDDTALRDDAHAHEESDENYLPPNGNNVDDENESNPVGREQPSSVYRATVGLVTRIFGDFFPQGRKEEKTSPSDEDAAVNVESTDSNRDVLDGAGEEGEADVSLSLAAGTLVKMRHSLDGNDAAAEEMDVGGSFQRAGQEPGSCTFKHFDIAKEPLDHHFLDGSDRAMCGRKWTKQVQKEWSILDKNLPDAIFVRVFEDRMDLLRAVIVGACGTPYQDGLFFFDFFLPPEYPIVPPSAYYHSGGLRINPNLYEEGKVCLSLLNTWTGKGNEVWDPRSSSILQVLVSIQGLVLNARPYFNEAGYEKQVGTAEGEKNAYPYNENTYLLNLRSMLYLLRRPPMHFEEFVKDHFRSRGAFILKACAAYMEGCPVGSLTKDACVTGSGGSNEQSSVGFKLMLAKITPKLFAALKDVGADCGEFEHLCGS